MTIKITTISETGNATATFTFDNSVDAAAERKSLEVAGIEYKVEWVCK